MCGGDIRVELFELNSKCRVKKFITLAKQS
jgi:hypothetical protein